jgi:hypothetical protein
MNESLAFILAGELDSDLPRKDFERAHEWVGQELNKPTPPKKKRSLPVLQAELDRVFGRGR